jgi:hypothetical protein
VWDTNFGGDIDFVDYGFGRTTFVANYQAILGEQFRNFDPNQGNYTLEGSSSVRSRPAGDRRRLSSPVTTPQRSTEAVSDRLEHGRRQASHDGDRRITHTDARVDWRGVVLHTYVDYKWELNAVVQNVHAFHPRVAAISGATLQILGVDGTRGRGTQTARRGEGGVRFTRSCRRCRAVRGGRAPHRSLSAGVRRRHLVHCGFRFLSDK